MSSSTLEPTTATHEGTTVTISRAGGVAVAVLRISLGFVFLWAFLDKTFGLNYGTPSERAWINGGSPTKGFLANVDFGPLQSFYNSIAGAWWANLLFMAGLFAIGVALILGIGLKIAAVANVVMMAMMWAAEWPLARFTSTGDPTGSNNPLIDYHWIYAAAGVVLAVIAAGRFFGLGSWWAKVTGHNTWLR
jgi:thiosulfate dehydrogenase [quinone] large subunit